MPDRVPHLVLVDPEPSMTRAWRQVFAAWRDDVEVVDGYLQDAPVVDAWVTAGNSYGEMSGGVDLAVARHFPSVQKAVWGAMADRTGGYLPVGSAVVVPSGAADVRWVVYAPTMRVPMPLTGRLEVAVHDALWAAFVAIGAHNADADGPDDHIASIACPGFGTGFGHVEPARAADLMAAAYRWWRAGPGGSLWQHEDDLR